MSEQDIVRGIIDALNQSGQAFVWRNQSGQACVRGSRMHLAPKGSPDIVGWMRDGTGRFVGLEVKTPKGVISPDQVTWQAEMQARGVVCGIVRSVEAALELVKSARLTRQST